MNKAEVSSIHDSDILLKTLISILKISILISDISSFTVPEIIEKHYKKFKMANKNIWISFLVY